MRHCYSKAILMGVAALAIAAASPASAATPYEEGLAAAHQADFGRALRLWRPLAEQGHAGAQASLGFLYSRGYGVPKDLAVAAAWFRKAADAGHAEGQALYGAACEKGEGVPKDEAEAARWYLKAAMQGQAHAQRNLGRMYSSGRGVARDRVKAWMWLELGAGSFAASDPKNREKSLKARDRVAKKMSSAELAEAARLAGEWKPAAATMKR